MATKALRIQRQPKIKDNQLRIFIRNGGRKAARKDFFELLRRAANTTLEENPIKRN